MALSLDGTTGLSASGNITGGNIVSTGSISVAGTLNTGTFSPSTLSTAGNVTGANIVTGGAVTAVGNVTGSYIIGNGSQLTGLPAGYTNANLASLGSNVVTTSGNITGGNLLTSGIVSATGNITSGNVNTGGNITGAWLLPTTGVSTGGNILVNGYISATGNLYVANIISSQQLTVDDPLLYLVANVTYPYVYDIGFYSAFTGAPGNTYQHTGLTRDYIDGVWKFFSNVPEPTGTTIDLTNAIYDPIKSGNILSVGTVSATGNIVGTYIIGNGSQLTGLPAGYTNANLASLGANVVSTTGNITGGNLLTGGLISATGTITSSTTITGGNLATAGAITGASSSVTGIVTGASVVGGVMTGSSVSVSGNVTGGNINTGAQVVATANITGGNLITAGQVVATANITGGNINTGAQVSATGNITGGNLSVGTGTITGGNIVNSNANGVGNIGSSTTYFNTVFAKATSAQYADLAEMYCADAEYAPGTVLDFGGEYEVTATKVSHSTQVAGIVSTQPSYLMNSALECVNAVEVALVGRVPCQVVGTIAKGDRLVASHIAGVATRLDISQYQPGCIVGKALEAYDSDTVGTIEVAVGRL